MSKPGWGCLGCEHIETAPKVLIDGRTVCSSCDEWRHQCEAQEIADMPGRQTRADELLKVEIRRGKPAGDRLRATVRQIFEARKAAP